MKSRPKIYLAAEAAGGVARHVIDLYFGLRKRNWPVQVILSPTRMEPMYQAEIATIPAAHLLILPMQRGPHWSDLAVMARLRNLFRNAHGRYLVHAHSTKAGLLGAALRPWIPKSLYTPHAYRSVDPTLSPMKRRLIQAAERTFSSTYDRVIAVAPAEYDHAITLGIQADRIRHIPNGVRVDAEGLKNRPFNPGARGKLTLGFVGRLARQKNPLLFLEVLREVAAVRPDVRAVIAGDGPLRTELQAFAEHSSLAHRIDWRGTVPFASVFHHMDVMVHTSFYEGMPYSLIESAGYRIPIVSTKNDGSAAILGELLPEAIVDSFDAKALAGRVLSLCSNPAVAARQMDGLEKIADHFSIDRLVESIEREYEILLAQ